MQRALGEYEILGVQTNVPFFRRILEHPDFLAGRIDTGFIDRALAAGLMIEEPPSAEEEQVALLAAALHVQRTRNSLPAATAPAPSAWKRAGREALLNAWLHRRRNDH